MKPLINVIEGIFDTKDVGQSIKDSVEDQLRKKFGDRFQGISNKTMIFSNGIMNAIPEEACAMYPNASIDGRFLIPYLPGRTDWVAKYEGGKNIPKCIEIGTDISIYTDVLKNVSIKPIRSNRNLTILNIQSNNQFPKFENVKCDAPDHEMQIHGKSTKRVMVKGITGEVRRVQIWLSGPALSAHNLDFRTAYQQKIAPKPFIDSKLKFMDAEITGPTFKKMLISKNPPITFSGEVTWEVDGWWYAIKNA